MHILFSYTQRLLLFILYNVMHMIYSSPVSAPWHYCLSFQVCSFQPLSFAGWTRFWWLGPKHCRYDCFCKYFSALCCYFCLRVVFIVDLDHLSFCSLIVLFPSTVFRCKIFWCRWWVLSFLWCRPWAYDQFFLLYWIQILVQQTRFQAMSENIITKNILLNHFPFAILFFWSIQLINIERRLAS